MGARIQQENAHLIILTEGELTVVTAGTPVPVPDNASARAVEFINNNAAGNFAVGLAASVSATSSPMKGNVLAPGDSVVRAVKHNANELSLDCDTNGLKVTLRILGDAGL